MLIDIRLRTQGVGFYEITDQINAQIPKNLDGLATLMIRHTSASLLIQENADPDVQTDLLAFFQRLVPPATDPAMRYLRHTLEGPDDMPAHIKAALMPVSLTIPVKNGNLWLGTWQGVYVVEHRDAPHNRHVSVQVQPDR